jgi:hypothetical protein
MFETAIDQFNQREFEALGNNLELLREDHPDLLFSVKRMIYASSVAAALEMSGNIVLPVWVPLDFAEYANATIDEALRDAGILPANRGNLPRQVTKKSVCMITLFCTLGRSTQPRCGS